ncbi:MAG: hydroxyethylthiazole kinase [Halanaerobium sp.]
MAHNFKKKMINQIYQKRWQKLKKVIREEKLLIHQISNIVTINDCANITLNWGALPVMSYFPEESVEIVKSSSALVLNLGTITEMRLDSMLKTGKKANELCIPIVLDPVGAGAAEYRTKAAEKIIKELKISIVKGNKAEISALAGENAELKGVESIGDYTKIDQTAKKLAAELNTIVVVSAETDIISNGKTTKKIARGSSLMAEVVGTGCMLGTTLGVFTAASKTSGLTFFEAVETAVYYYNLAAEKAEIEEQTPAKFKREFMDNIYLFNK